MNLATVLDRGGLVSAVLSGPAMVYGNLVSLRAWAYGKGILESVRVPVPVFCFGNITVGGTGKTPGVAWLTSYLLKKGRRPVILTRGYRRHSSPLSLKDNVIVVSDGKTILEDVRRTGDEPLLLARRLKGVPVFACADRVLAAEKAIEDGSADCLVMDDGFQHFRLQRDLNLVCVDAEKDGPAFLNGTTRLLPAGRLREPVSGLARAGVIFLTKYNFAPPETAARLRENVEERFAGVPVVPVRYELTLYDGDSPIPPEKIRGMALLAVSGLAAPQSFETGLERLGAQVKSIRFDDHHFFSNPELKSLLELAERERRRVVVTEKDYQRLPQDFPCLIARLEWIPEDEEKEGRTPSLWTEKVDSVIS